MSRYMWQVINLWGVLAGLTACYGSSGSWKETHGISRRVSFHDRHCGWSDRSRNMVRGPGNRLAWRIGPARAGTTSHETAIWALPVGVRDRSDMLGMLGQAQSVATPKNPQWTEY